MITIPASIILQRLTRITELISYAEFCPQSVNFQNARLEIEHLKREVIECAEPHAAILPVGERHARIVIER